MKYVFFDIDGTVADNRHRVSYVTTDYKKYVALGVLDKPIAPIVDVCQMYLKNKTNYSVSFLTGRQEWERELTLDWLWKHVWPSIPSESVWMRPNRIDLESQTKQQGFDMKLEWAMRIAGDINNIHVVYEDRNHTVKTWREAGVICIQPTESEF